jgi:hypothetical protein
MALVLRIFLALLAWLRNSQARRDAEILYLRQLLIVLSFETLATGVLAFECFRNSACIAFVQATLVLLTFLAISFSTVGWSASFPFQGPGMGGG